MQGSYTWGLFAAALLGSAAGVAIAPPPARDALLRRAIGNITTLQVRYREWLTAPRIDASIATDRLKAAIAADANLGKRRIWVDSYGGTILLNGVVESDEEWRFADRLARAASYDGSVRNLLQIRREPPAG